MLAKKIYEKLEQYFILRRGLSDDWKFTKTNKYLSNNFKERSMGVVYDFSKEIKKVYTAVFPEEKVLKKIIAKKETDLLLFVHHPQVWDIRKKEVFEEIPEKYLKIFKERRISIYCLHVPLDNFSKFSTTNTLSKALNIKVETQFCPYFGGLCGVLGIADTDKVTDVKKNFEKAVGHKIKLYKYGDSKIINNKVALVAGGGNNLEILEKIPKECNLFITGITTKNNYSKEAHEYLKKRKINLLGGTHYSTEKFACILMVDYFKKQGLPSEFIEGTPILEDM
jgi:putative NIF3 family GTP cyclohydrolase 1 type 2